MPGDHHIGCQVGDQGQRLLGAWAMCVVEEHGAQGRAGGVEPGPTQPVGPPRERILGALDADLGGCAHVEGDLFEIIGVIAQGDVNIAHVRGWMKPRSGPEPH